MMKAQFTIYAIFMAFVSLILLVALLPVMSVFISDFVANSTDTATNSIVLLIPMFMALGVVVGMVWYMMPQRETSGGYGG